MFDVIVFASGRGTNFAALLQAQQQGILPIRLRALLSDRPAAPAVAIARDAGIPTVTLAPAEYPDRASFDRAIFVHAAKFSPDLIVLAGFMRVIDSKVIAPWQGKIINIHPSLLPKYPGLYTHRRALEAGDATHGASVHFVTAELDGGPLIAQVELPVLAGDTSKSLASRLLPLEHRLLTASVDQIARGRIAFWGNGVEFDGTALTTPLRLNAEGEFDVVG